MCETGQRLRSFESGLKGQQHYILGIFCNLFGLYNVVLIVTLFYYRDLVLDYYITLLGGSLNLGVEMWVKILCIKI